MQYLDRFTYFCQLRDNMVYVMDNELGVAHVTFSQTAAVAPAAVLASATPRGSTSPARSGCTAPA